MRDDIDPEVAQPVGLGPHQSADQCDGDGETDSCGEEVLNREAGHLHEMAHGRLARIPLPVGVRDKRDSGVEGASRRDAREVQGERQITLQPLEAEQNSTDTMEKPSSESRYVLQR